MAPRKGFKHSELSRQQMSESQRQRWTPEMRKALSRRLKGTAPKNLTHAGLKHSAKTKAAIALANRGRRRTPEQIKRITASSRRSNAQRSASIKASWTPARRAAWARYMRSLPQDHRQLKVIGASKGVPRTKEWKKHISESKQSHCTDKQLAYTKRLSEQHESRHERSVHTCLTALNVQYRKHEPIAGRFVADIYLPECNAIIECDGEYWHKRNPAQKAHDKRRDARIRAQGIRVVRIAGRDIDKDAMKTVQKALQELQCPLA